MGVGPLSGRSCSVYPDVKIVEVEKIVYPPNPDPARFKILGVQEVGDHCVAIIQYPDCTNYEGIKFCVWEHTTEEQLRSRTRLDPHFDKTRFSPCARFKPDGRGWLRAVKFARSL